MKRVAVFSLAVLMCMLLLGGCGKGKKAYDVQQSTVFIEKDGTVTSVDVEEFDEDTYDKDGLESYVKDSIEEYNEENGEDAVTLSDLSVKNGTATLRLSYASAEDYANFTGIELYTGSVAQALAQGFLFDVDFASVTDSGKATSCAVSDFLGGDYNVVIIKGNTNVSVDGTVDYLSIENTSWVDKSTVAISEGTSLIDGAGSAVEDTEGAQEVETTEAAEETTEDAEESDSVDEDELLALEEDTEVVFEFDDDDETDDTAESSGEISSVYTYIIYK